MTDPYAAVEERLRDEFRNPPPGPDPDDMLRRVTRRRRRRPIAAAVVGVLVLVVTVGIVSAVGRPGANGPTPQSTPSGLTMGERPTFVFVDADHGYLVLERCVQSVCETWLASTSDGGATWRPRLVPDLVGRPDGLGPPAQLREIDASRVVFDSFDGQQRWFSADAGVTWERFSPAPVGTVDTIPPYARATVETNGSRPVGIVVLKPDGRSARLRTPPATAVNNVFADVMFGADGSAWVLGSDDEATRAFVSRDRGRTWASVPLPAGVGPALGVHLITVDGGTAYLVDPGGYRLWRTTDDGRHWRSLPSPVAKPTEDIGLVAVGRPDGGLIVYDAVNRRGFAIAADGERFEPVPAGPYTPVGRVGARYLGTGAAWSVVAHSVDGVNWTDLPR